jgi:alkylated DNA repair protein (DNA oxidative demethylase)
MSSTKYLFRESPSQVKELRQQGVFIFRNFLAGTQHEGLPLSSPEEVVIDLRRVIRDAPLYTPTMRNGKPFRYRMTCCGKYGWLSDSKGYRYEAINPYTEKPWPRIPRSIHDAAVSAALMAGFRSFKPETCLINFYSNKEESLGLHQDSTERNLNAPVISLSLGDSGVFLLGGNSRTDSTQPILLESGDCLVLGGAARSRFHSFARTLPGTSDLLKHGGRLSLTIRQVD